jgi:K+-sensing histidine kinase KdpD
MSDDEAARPRRRRAVLGVRRQVGAGAAAVGVLVVLTWLLEGRDDVSIAIVFLLYLAAVVGLSAAGGPIVGVGVAIAAFFVVNWFFSEPLHTLDVADSERLAELIIFLGVSGTVAALVDAIGRRQVDLDERTAEAQALAAANDLRTALLRAVSHDLRTPLATAKMATSSLLADDVRFDDASRRELVTMADEEIDRLVRIVENLLDAGRLQAGALTARPEPTPVTDLLGRAVETLPRADRARIRRGDEPAPEVLVDPALLERVLVNLLANALAADRSQPIELRTSTGPDRATIEVVDHGPGMSPDEIALALQPFHRDADRATGSGVGLGLSICVGLCAAMDVGFELAPTDGGGLTARLLAPVAP